MKRPYILTILTTEGETNTSPLQTRIAHAVKELDGEFLPERIEQLRRRFAYPIKKQTRGNTYTFNVLLAPDQILSFQKFLRRSADVLRWRLVSGSVDPDLRTLSDVADAQHVRDMQKSPGRKQTATREAQSKDKTPAPTKKEAMKDLDKKIDEILKEEVL